MPRDQRVTPARKKKPAPAPVLGARIATVPAPAQPQASVPAPDAPWDEGPPLNERQHRFLERMLIDPNATRAYMDAYGVPYETALTSGPRMMGNVRIARALELARQQRAARSVTDADTVIKELERIASQDLLDVWEDSPAAYEGGEPGPMRLKPLKDWPLEARRAIAGMKIKRVPARVTGDGLVLEEAHEVMEIKFHNKLDALKLLGLHHGAKFNRAPLDEKGNAVLAPPQQFIIAGQVVIFQ